MVQAARQAKDIAAEFTSYVDAAFPYRRKVEEEVKNQQQKVLTQWTAMGKIPIMPSERDDPEKGLRERQREKGRKLQMPRPAPKNLPGAWTPSKRTRSASSTVPVPARSPVRLHIPSGVAE